MQCISHTRYLLFLFVPLGEEGTANLLLQITLKDAHRSRVFQLFYTASFLERWKYSSSTVKFVFITKRVECGRQKREISCRIYVCIPVTFMVKYTYISAKSCPVMTAALRVWKKEWKFVDGKRRRKISRRIRGFGHNTVTTWSFVVSITTQIGRKQFVLLNVFALGDRPKSACFRTGEIEITQCDE